MKTFYAVGDVYCKVPILCHPYEGRAGANCSFFPPCPLVHLDVIPETLFIDNYHDCKSFAVFESKEDAKNFAIHERFKNSLGGGQLFLIFKVQIEEYQLSEMVNEREFNYYKINPDTIAALEKPKLDLGAIFGNVKPELLQSSGCTIL